LIRITGSLEGPSSGLKNNLPAAREAWNTGHAYCEKLPDFGTYNYDRDRYRRIREILDDQSGAVEAAEDHSMMPIADPGLQPYPA
jgi:hypothetical protein